MASQVKTIMKTAPSARKEDLAAWTRATRTAWAGRRGPNLFRRSASPCVEIRSGQEKGWAMVAVQDIGARELIDEMTLEDVDFDTDWEFGRYSWVAYGLRKGPDSKIHCIHAVNEPSPGEAVNAIIQRECSNTHEGQDIWVLQTTRRIKPGEEVLTWYGPDFERDYDASRDAETDFRNGIEQVEGEEDTSEEEETFVDIKRHRLRS